MSCTSGDTLSTLHYYIRGLFYVGSAFEPNLASTTWLPFVLSFVHIKFVVCYLATINFKGSTGFGVLPYILSFSSGKVWHP